MPQPVPARPPLLLLLTALVLPACSGDSEPAPRDGGVESCQRDEECGAGSICSIGRCKAGCRTAAGCPAGSDCIDLRCVSRPDGGLDAGPDAGRDAGPDAGLDGGGDSGTDGGDAGEDAERDGGAEDGPDGAQPPCTEAEKLALCPDTDDDRHGDRLLVQRLCPPIPAGWTTICDDCDDGRADVHPGARELCNDRDENCDGQPDEGLGLGEVCAVGLGICRQEGHLACDALGRVACDAVPGLPAAEQCNDLDDDCNGTIDDLPDGCDCLDGDVRPCGSDVGECAPGEQTCLEGRWGECLGETGPTPETCNGKDDDCNGVLDDALGGCDCQEGQERPCGSDIGECTAGRQTCAAGRWGQCTGEIGPAPETCNGKDDDCNGVIDDATGGCDCVEGEEQPCGTDVGECTAGQQTCLAGRWGECAGEVGPRAETCNEKDDDCDGETDEGACGGCPEDMVEVDGRFCIDRWEASRPDATAGTMGVDTTRAVSRAGVIPWYVSQMSQAVLLAFDGACRASGKRLCTKEEWYGVCTGPEQNLYFFGNVWDQESCNNVDSFCDDYCAAQAIEACDLAANCGYRYGCFKVVPTASFPRCVNADGVFDINGNVWEVVPDASARGYQVRGGAFNCAGAANRLLCTYDAGWDALYAGFRCCKEREEPIEP